MALILRTDGTVEKLEPAGPRHKLTLDQLQAGVGGYIELVRADGAELGMNLMVVNEEGLLDGLPLNPAASVLARQQIVGDAILCADTEID